MSSGFEDFLLPGASRKEVTGYRIRCRTCDYVGYSFAFPRVRRCPKDGGPLHVSEAREPLERLPAPTSEQDVIREELASLPEAHVDSAREVLIALKSGETIATQKLQADLRLSPFIFVAIVTSLADLGLVDIESEGTPKEGVRLTTRGKRLLKNASVI
jgi:hypothetical protein